jgi:hypothetical protein
MSCRDPEILGLRERAEAGSRSAAEARRIASWLTAAESVYRREIRVLATGMRNWDEETVRAFVSTHTGGRTTSRAETTRAERGRMLARLRADGLLAPRSGAVRQHAAAQPREALAAKLRALLTDTGRSDAYANAIARKRWDITRWEWLEHEALGALVQMLIVDQTRGATRRVVLALAQGRPWGALLSHGEHAHGIAERAAAQAHKRGWITVDAEGEPQSITERGREIAAHCAEDKP